MKIILCTPYIGGPDFVQGGLVVWSKNVIDYSNKVNSCDIVPVSFDRTVKGRAATNIFTKAYYDITEIGHSVKAAIYTMNKSNESVLHLCSSAGVSLLKDIAILKAARSKGIPSVIHFHFGRIPELFEQKNKEYNRLLKVLKLADTVVCMDLQSCETLRQHGYTNVEYLPNPLPLNVSGGIHANTGDRIAKQLLFVGHVYKTKGVYELVEACSRINDVNLRIVGKYTDEVKDELVQISSRRPGDWLQLVGEVDHDNVLNEFQTSDMFVFPSYTEGFPYVILEAMASGIPIISSGVGAIPEMLNGGKVECGIIIPPQDTNAVYDAICSLINNNNRKAELGINAAKRVNEMYSMPVVWNQLNKIWKETYEHNK